MSRPPVDELAKLCIVRAWAEDVDDESRLLLEYASRELRRLATRCLRLSREIELMEARCANSR